MVSNNLRRVVKYQNRLNEVTLRDFKPTEMDLFFAIAAQVRDKGTDTVTLTFDQLKGLTGYTRSSERLVGDLSTTYNKLLKLTAASDDGITLTQFVLFTMFEANRQTQTVTIAVNKQFKSLFNNLDKWTVFGLEDFIGLNSTYSKNIFRLVKQFRTTGYRRWSADEFKEILDIPSGYTNYQIQSRIIDVVNKELPKAIKGFKLEAIRLWQVRNPNGKPVTRGKLARVVAYQANWIKEPAKSHPLERRDVTPKASKTISDRKYQKRAKVVETLPEWAREGHKREYAPATTESSYKVRLMLAYLNNSNGQASPADSAIINHFESFGGTYELLDDDSRWVKFADLIELHEEEFAALLVSIKDKNQ